MNLTKKTKRSSNSRRPVHGLIVEKGGPSFIPPPTSALTDFNYCCSKQALGVKDTVPLFFSAAFLKKIK
jgi:hypothetical protein